MVRHLFLLLSPLLVVLCACSSSPPSKIHSVKSHASRYPAPPVIFSHVMTSAHSMKAGRMRYSPTAVFKLADCDGCLFVYDEVSVTDKGDAFISPGVDGTSIVKQFGAFHGGSLTSETGWASANVVRFCYRNLRICKSEDAASCTALNPRFAYELDLETGRLNTNLAVIDPNLRQPASTAKGFQSLCPSSKSVAK